MELWVPMVSAIGGGAVVAASQVAVKWMEIRFLNQVEGLKEKNRNLQTAVREWQSECNEWRLVADGETDKKDDYYATLQRYENEKWRCTNCGDGRYITALHDGGRR